MIHDHCTTIPTIASGGKPSYESIKVNLLMCVRICIITPECTVGELIHVDCLSKVYGVVALGWDSVYFSLSYPS
jgi:hypothetical protein